MRHTLIGLTGKKRSGKDALADRLVTHHGYAKIGMADPVRALALRVNPTIVTQNGYARSLGDLVDQYGWDWLQSNERRVRALLQDLGGGVREQNPDHWIGIARERIIDLQWQSFPVVVTGIRFPNEGEHIVRHGGIIVRVTRPGTDDPTDPTTKDVSETSMDSLPIIHREIVNNGTLDDLYSQADDIARELERRRT